MEVDANGALIVFAVSAVVRLLRRGLAAAGATGRSDRTNRRRGSELTKVSIGVAGFDESVKIKPSPGMAPLRPPLPFSPLPAFKTFNTSAAGPVSRP